MSLQYSYEANVGEYEARVSVVWNGDHYVGSLSITLYKCDILGSHRDHADCSLCVTRAKKYRCAWCGSVCAYSEACPLTAATECPRPRIDVVSPFYRYYNSFDSIKLETKSRRILYRKSTVKYDRTLFPPPSIKLETKSCRISYRKSMVKYDRTLFPAQYLIWFFF